jgi:hypothetical protein
VRAHGLRTSLGRALFRALLAILAPVSALAQEPARAASAQGVIDIVVVGADDDVRALESALGPGEFGGNDARFRRGERLELERLLHTGAADALVRCYVDLSRPGRADLYFADRTAERFLVRQVALPDGLDELGRETLGQVLTLSVFALLENDADTLSRDETRALLAEKPAAPSVSPVPEPEAPAETSPSGSVGLEPFYALRAFAGGALVSHGPGLDIGWLAGSEHATNAVWLGAAYELKRSYRDESAGMTWSALTLRGSFEHLEPVSGALLLGARGGAGVDWTSFVPESGTGDDNVTLRDARVTTSFLVHLGVSAKLALGTRFHASFLVFADFYPTRARYAIERSNGEAHDVLEPFRVRPGVALGLLLH